MSEPETHSRLAPSSAKQWVQCTASIKYIADNQHRIPVDTGSTYADEGTIAHQWCSDILDGLRDISEVPEEMRPHVADYVAFAERLTTDKDERLVEAKVALFYKKEDNGTVDFALISDERVYILDLKYGAGVNVEAKENLQLAIYALSLIEEYKDLYKFSDDSLVTMAIFQPRTYEGSPTKIWTVTLGQLELFALPIADAATVITIGNTDNLEFTPSDDACQWCSAKGFCKARAQHYSSNLKTQAVELLTDLTETKHTKGESYTVPAPDFETLSEAQITAIVKNASSIKSWLNSVESEAYKLLEAGSTIEGLKLVQGKLGNRTWLDIGEADTLIKSKLKADQRYTKKLITLPQAEKLLKPLKLSTRFNNRFNELTHRPPGKPVLTTTEDPRECINTTAADVLTDLSEQDLM